MSRRRWFQVLIATIVTAFLLAFSGIASAQGNSANAFERVKEVQERHTDRLMELDGVVGTAVGSDEKGGHAVLVLLERPGVPAVPTDVEGVPVRAVVTGVIHALAKPQPSGKPTKPPRDTTAPMTPGLPTLIPVSSCTINLDWPDNAEADLSHYHVYRAISLDGPYTRLPDVTSSSYPDSLLAPLITYWYALTAVDTSGNESGQSEPVSATTLLPSRSPSPIGVSTGHPNITAGTIGCRVVKNGNVYALSNNHVYANENKALIGDNVLQPGPYDGGVNPGDAIGVLAEFKTITFSRYASNTIDAAIALCSTATLGNSTPSGYGTPSSTTSPAALGQAVQKYGRTTELTLGQVYALNATVSVRYSTGTARFVNQIIITPGGFSAGGDSGSLIVTQNGNHPVGLLFAGSTSYTIANPIDAVLAYFGVTVDGL